MFEKFRVPKELIPSDPRFGVGPSKIPMEFVKKLAETGNELLGTSHRKPNVIKLYKEIQEGLRGYFDLPTDYEVVMGNGGATFLFDMIGLGLVEKKSLHYTCGEFSQKWFKAHKNIPWIEATERSCSYGEGIEPSHESGFDMICATLNETSTGVMINTLPDVDDRTILAIDATSGAGQIKIDFKKVDLYFFSPQKVFAGEGGFFVAIMSPKAIKRAMDQCRRSEYIPEVMRWDYAIEKSRLSQTYNTPAISTAFYLNEQIKLMNEIGEDKVIELARTKANLIYNWAEEKTYLSPFILNKVSRSIAVATINVDEKYPVGDLVKRLRELHVAYDIEAYRKLGLNQLRIGMFHNIDYADLEKLTRIISLAIEAESGRH